MSLFLSGWPLWVTALLLVVLPIVLAATGLVLVHRKVGLTQLTLNNEVAGFKFAVVGVIYAVLLAFAVIVLWERFAGAETAVAQETGAAATLYRLIAGTESEAVETRAALDNYLKLVIERDWPQMATAGESLEVTQALNNLYAAALRLVRSGSNQAPVFGEMFYQFDQLTGARRTRLVLARGIVPVVLWVALIVGGIVTVGVTYFFGVRNLAAQLTMTAILSLVVCLGIWVIISIIRSQVRCPSTARRCRRYSGILVTAEQPFASACMLTI